MSKYFTEKTLILPFCKLTVEQLEHMPTRTPQDRELLKKIFRIDFFAFAIYFFKNPTPEGRKGIIDIKFGIPQLHKDIVSKVLMKMGSEIEWGLIVAPRGYSKTTLLQIFSIYCILFGLSNNIMYVIETSESAELYLEWIKDELELNTRIELFFGKLRPKKVSDGTGKAWNMSKVVTATRRCFYAIGMRKRIRGNKFLTDRPDIIVDDIESHENTKTTTQMRKNMSWFNKDVFFATRDDDGWILVSGNFLKPGCLVEKIYRNKSWKKVKFAAMNEDLTESTWELKKPARKLLAKKEALESSGDYETFWLELMNNPKKAGSKRFDPDDYRFWVGNVYSREMQYLIIDRMGQNFPNSSTIDWQKKQMQRIPVDFYLGIDLAFTEEEVNDFNDFSTNAIDANGIIYDIEQEKFKTNRPSDIIDKIISKDTEYRYKGIAIEANGAQIVVYNNLMEECQRLRLTNLAGKIRPIIVQLKNKHARILGTLQPKMKVGKYRFRCEKYGDTYKVIAIDYIQQYDEFSPSMEHDDMIDGAEMCVNIMKPATIKSIYDDYEQNAYSKTEIYLAKHPEERWKIG